MIGFGANLYGQLVADPCCDALVDGVGVVEYYQGVWYSLADYFVQEKGAISCTASAHVVTYVH